VAAERGRRNLELHWKETPPLAKMRRSRPDSPDRFIQIVSLTTMVPIPRYRLAVERQVAEKREDGNLAREVTRAAMD
jgi:hypothetical protein